MRVISIVNQKGGVGKTTTTLNLAVALKLQGNQVLLIDADQQANLTASITHDLQEKPLTLSELIYYTVAGLEYGPAQFIAHGDGLDIIMSSKLLAAANSNLGTASNSDSILTKALSALARQGAEYDFVLIDCPRTLDLLVTNCLNASDSVIIPTEPAEYSIDGIVDVWETVTRLRNTTNPRLQVEHIIINKYSVNKKGHRTRANEIMEAFEDIVFSSPIPLLKEVEESPNDIYSMSKDRRSKSWPLWMELAEEVIQYGES